MTAPEPIPAPLRRRTVNSGAILKPSRAEREAEALAKRMAADLPPVRHPRGSGRPPAPRAPRMPDKIVDVFTPPTDVDGNPLPKLVPGDRVPIQPPDEPMTNPTREAWLNRAVERIRADVAGMDETPPVRVSIGWPGGRGKKAGVIGQCWAKTAVDDGIPAIFISPALKDPKGERGILATLVHELVHSRLPNHAHRAPFAKGAAQAGLEGPWTATKAGPELLAYIDRLADDLGPFDHGRVNGGGSDGAPKPQTTRMLKLECPDCGYTVRTTAKWIAVGIPLCPNTECPSVMNELEQEVK